MRREDALPRRTMWPNIRLGLLLFASLLGGLSTTAHGQTTVSYAHRYSSSGLQDDGASKIAVDSAGDTYGLFQTSITAPNSSVVVQQSWTLLKLDPVGNTLWKQTMNFSGLASPSALYLDAGANAYVGGTSFSSTTTGSTAFFAFSAQGVKLWSSSLIAQSGARDKVLAITTDTSGNCVAACQVTQSTGKIALEMVSITPLGVASSAGIDPLMRPNHASFFGPNCLVTGEDNAATGFGGSRWGDYSLRAVRLFGGTAANTYNAAAGQYTQVSHQMNGDTAGNVYVFTNLQTVNVSGSTTSMTNSSACYSSTGHLVWSTASEQGMVYYASCGGPDYVYTLASLKPGPLTTNLNLHNHLGALRWSRSLAATAIQADLTSGVFVAYTYAQTINFEKFDESGNMTWSGTYTADTAYRSNGIAQMLVASGALHAICTVSGPNGFLGAIGYADALMVDVFEGIEVETLTGPSSVTGGSTANLSVVLNGPAPSSGLSVTLSVSGSAANFGGKNSITVNVPAGASRYSLAMNTTSVTSTQNVTVRAVCATSERDLSVAITP